MTGFMIIGHRGSMATEPENTMRSFLEAERLGVDAIELDVHLSRDGHLVVMHDPTVDRTTDGTGAIADLTWAELQRLDAGQGERILELGEVWESLDGVGLEIEVKAPAATDAVMDLITTGRTRPHPSVTITSFHPDAVRRAVATDGPWHVGLICGARQLDKLRAELDSGVDVLMINQEIGLADEVRRFRDRGGRTHVWPCRTPDDIATAMADGWTGTTVDDPAMGLAARAAADGRPLPSGP